MQNVHVQLWHANVAAQKLVALFVERNIIWLAILTMVSSMAALEMLAAFSKAQDSRSVVDLGGSNLGIEGRLLAAVVSGTLRERDAGDEVGWLDFGLLCWSLDRGTYLYGTLLSGSLPSSRTWLNH